MASGDVESKGWVSYLDFIPITGSEKSIVEAVIDELKGNHKQAEEKAFLGFQGNKADLISHQTGSLIDNVVFSGAIKTLAIIAGEVALKEGDSTVNIKTAASLTLKEADPSIVKILGEDTVRNLGEKAAKATLKEEKDPLWAAIKEAGKVVIKHVTGKGMKDIVSVQKLVDKKMGFLKLFGTIDISSLTDDKLRSKRGEHVFNNDILKIFKKMIDNLIDTHYVHLNYNFECLVQKGFISRDSKIYQAYYHPLPKKYQEAIETEMVAQIPEKVFYINANSVIYGQYMKCFKAMISYYLDLQFSRLVLLDPKTKNANIVPQRSNIYYMIEMLNSREVYVDDVAKDYWIRGDPKREAHFQDVKSKVAQMFGGLVADDRNEISCWMTELMMGTGHLFHQRVQP
ncbi:uncharacterized protein LOC115482532 [Microcaecilia unicolor]|uniref:Uncharacterized protein LOC115482532 n=1 Tax=Microcaecilia unicolor TaxID=1415580 RepID=A0A6P7ZWE8_9AMPH|nr:uncharacterized protein LOC115482532 [Microcaecilia unicolor]